MRKRRHFYIKPDVRLVVIRDRDEPIPGVIHYQLHAHNWKSGQAHLVSGTDRREVFRKIRVAISDLDPKIKALKKRFEKSRL